MTKIYIVSSFTMEPYSDYGNRPEKAFTSKEAAKQFVAEHYEVYDEGYYKWDEETETDVPCDESHEDAIYNYGWKYSSYIEAIELIEG